MALFDQHFEHLDFTAQPLPSHDFEDCAFSFCHFSEVSLMKVRFSNCKFTHCNLSLCHLNGTAFRQVRFENCKMLGLHFENANTLGIQMTFHHCNLTHASFFQLTLKKTLFNACKLCEVDFTESDFTQSQFQACDFAGAIFYNTNLEQVDFRTSVRYSIHPEKNKIKKAQFSQSDIHGLPDQYGILIE
jgi:uncharacterized protein YjbI with pentapeptide repeats